MHVLSANRWGNYSQFFESPVARNHWKGAGGGGGERRAASRQQGVKASSEAHAIVRISIQTSDYPATQLICQRLGFDSVEPNAALLVIRICLSANIWIIPFAPQKICSVLILICKSRLIETFRTWQGFLIDFLVFLNHVPLVSTFYLASTWVAGNFRARCFLLSFTSELLSMWVPNDERQERRSKLLIYFRYRHFNVYGISYINFNARILSGFSPPKSLFRRRRLFFPLTSYLRSFKSICARRLGNAVMRSLAAAWEKLPCVIE